ncbi:kelch repeat-containing protein [Nakamurella deserti]|uniref:Kelch repeat-containing protein n=1 Tax=Nakamurella deserti TaxID=2164074 RepID=UPI000DBE6CB5|nr:kelch repeat-containing protein [Nakamurella deserti]
MGPAIGGRRSAAAVALAAFAGLVLGVAPASAHEGDAPALQVSGSAGRSPSSTLSGATVRGPVHVFLPATAGVTAVRFWLDDPAMAGAPRQIERTAPYDLAGGTDTAATPLSTTSLTEGSHTVSYTVTYSDADVVSGAATFTVDNVPDQPAPAPSGPTTRINAGGPAVTVSGRAFAADSYATGGKSYRNPSVTAIAGTTDDALYLDERSATTSPGSFAYAIPAGVPGDHTVTLHFAELYHGAPGGGPGGAGRRVFSVNAEGGAAEVVDLDLFATVGAMTATTRSFTVPVTDGRLDLAFTATVDQPTVAAIEVTAPAGSPALGDPTPFTWETRMPSPIGRSEGQGAAVGSKVYVFGGFATGTITTARSDVYDTVTDTWTRLPDMPEEITHSATVVDGTTVWIVGGYVDDHPGPATRHVWKFDTVRRTFSAGPQLPAPRGAGAAAIVGRELHFYGGTNRVAGSTADPDQPDHWVLNLDGGTTWTARAPLPNPRNHLTGATLDGKVYAIGGQYNENENTGLQTDVHRYDPATDAWTKVASLPRARSHLVAVVRDGQILALGGTNPGNVASSDVTAYDPASNTWSQLPSLPGGRKTPVVATVGDTVVVSGGSHATATYRGRLAARWATGPAMPVALGEVAGGVVGGSLYLVGEGNSATLALNLGTGVWRRDLPVRPFVGHHHTAEVVNGRLYLFGGLGAGAGKVQIFDPVTNRWTLGPDMPFAAGSSSSAVINGRVYVAGGIIGSTTTDRVARFDPATNTWAAMASMPQGRNHAAATTDGSLLYVAGGRGAGSGDGNVVANGFDTLQVYDPAANSWRSSAYPASGLPALPQARGGTGRAVFSGGEIYVMGGETDTGAGATSRKVYQRVDVYNPQTRTWRLGTPMPTGRHGIYPVLVGNRITVAGGGVQAANSSSSVVEVYTVR